MFRKKDNVQSECEYCGKQFLMKTYHQKFCSPECRNSHHNDEKAAAIQAWREHQKAVGNK